MKFKVWAIPAALILLMGLVLSGCSVISSTPSPLPTVVLGSGNTAPGGGEATEPALMNNGGVTASGIIVPAQQAQMAFSVSGKVQAVNVHLGDLVQAGQALAVLDTTEAQLAVRQAEAELAAAQASFNQASATLPSQRESELAAARLALLQAQRALSNLEQNAQLESATAQLALVEAQKALDEAQRNQLNMKYPRANQTTIDGARAHYDLMEDELEKAREAYDSVSDLPASDPERAQALLNLTNAQKERDRALSTLNWYLGKNSEEDIAEADAQVALAQAQLSIAQSKLAELKDGPSAEDVAVAEAGIASAQASLNFIQTQSAAEQLAQVQAQLDMAQVHLELAQAQLAKMTLSAPFAGTVAALHLNSGEWVMPGQVVLVLVDLSRFRVETTDLSERDVIKVELGQEVGVLIKATNQEVTGHVSAISPLANTLGGDVVYQTIIELDEPPTGLLAGMSVDVLYR